MIKPVYITACASVSALGSSPSSVWKGYLDDEPRISFDEYDNDRVPIAKISDKDREQINLLRASDRKYKNLDDSVLFAIYVARKAVDSASWVNDISFGINFGSSRGATSLFEKYYDAYKVSKTSHTLSSPTTTLGNISSWVAHDLQTEGPEISHSITCSTALHSLLNGIAWLNSGMCSKFLVGGSEAPLTGFTIAQMKALKVYSKHEQQLEYPCLALDLSKDQNTMVLGEGAAAICIEHNKNNAIAKIEGVGYATEILKHNTSVTQDAYCFQKSMKMALKMAGAAKVDAIVMHAPGTIKGDLSEYNAIEKVFGENKPLLTSNKWKIGHTFGASGLLSLELALLMLQNQIFIPVPYVSSDNSLKKINTVLVNAVGFGGNAVSVLLSKV